MTQTLPELTDAHWRAIVAAATPQHAPSAQAREAVENCLRDYRALRAFRSVDPAAQRKDRKEWERKVRLARDLGDALGEDHRHLPAVRDVQRWAKAMAEATGMVLRARQGRRDAATEWFYGRIFEIWTDEFDGGLTVTSPTDGGPPKGPLVRFVRAVAEHAMEAPPSPYTIEDRVDRELERRKGVLKSKT